MTTPSSTETETETETVRVRDLVGARHVELHRPEALNAWTPQMGRELLAALSDAAADPAVRAVLITGAGRAFCAGADVKNAREQTADGSPDLSGRLRELYNPIITTVRSAPKPVVVAIHGACAGLGVSLALAGDLLLAADDAYLLLAFARIGVMPDGGVLPALAERIGVTRATELAMLAEKLPADRAETWGLVTAVHPAAELADRAIELTQRLAAGPTVAFASTKTVLAAAAQPRLEELLTLEADLQQRHAGTHDYAEGRAAFVEKRAARFLGR